MVQLDFSNKPRARRAFDLALAHHDAIYRKYTNEPYIEHPVRVTETLLRYGFNSEDVMCAALLHDCMEDEDVNGLKMSQHVIDRECGLKVARWVKLLTKPSGGTRADRNDRYNRMLMSTPNEVRAIKLADILDNVTGLAALDPQFAETYLNEKETQAKFIGGPAGVANLRRLVLDQIAHERETLALQVLSHGQQIDALRKADAAAIGAILDEEERLIYADAALF